MRLSAACLFLCLTALPAAAASIADQAHAAYQAFAGGLSQSSFLTAQYGKTALIGIAGHWVRLNGPDNKSGAESYGPDTEKFCKSAAALTLDSPDPLTLQLAASLPGANFTQSYTLIAGSTFGEHTEAQPYLTAIGLGPDKTGETVDQQRALALSLANGLVQIYRPSDDILVMTRDRGYPIILARCAKP